MTTTSLSRSTPIDTRVLTATTRLLITRGISGLRTAEIASVAGTTESTLFRHFSSLSEVLSATYRRAWALVNTAVSDASFNQPVGDDPVQVLLRDTAAIWNMRFDPENSEAALVAFLFLRRRNEILGPGSVVTDEQERYETRLNGIVASIVAAKRPDLSDRERTVSLLRTLILNYSATVWLTWACMPTGSDDITDTQHDLSPDEAQLGILSLIDRAVGAEIGDVHSSRLAE